MAKITNSIRFKGLLDIDLENASGTIEEIVKDEPKVYDIVDYLKRFNGKSISIVVSEEEEPDTVEG